MPSGRAHLAGPRLARGGAPGLAVAMVLAAVLAAPMTARAANTLPVAGDGEHLWVVQHSEGGETADEAAAAEERGLRWVVRHRAETDELHELNYAGTVGAAVEAAGVAASRGTLWLIDARGRTHLLRVSEAEGRPGWTYERHHGPALPEGTRVRALDVGEGGTFALVRVESAAALRAIEEAAEPRGPSFDTTKEQQLLRWMILGIPPDEVLGQTLEIEPPATPETPEDQAPPAAPELRPAPNGASGADDAMPPAITFAEADDADAQGEGEGAEASAAAQADAADEPVSEDRLLRLHRGRWRPVALPADWAETGRGDALAGLIAPREAGRPVRLLTQEAERVRVYERPIEARGVVGDAGQGAGGEQAEGEAGDDRDAATWRVDDYTLDSAAPLRPVIMDGQLVTVQGADQAGALAVRLTVLRRGSARPVGTLRMVPEAGAVRRWGAAGLGASAAVVAETDRPAATERDAALRELWWARVNLRGELEVEPAAMTEAEGPALEHLTDYIILVLVLVLAMLMMLLFWRRDASQFQLSLPADQTLAPLSRRAVAGVLDLAPPVAVAMVAFGVGFGELPQRWPGVGQARGVMEIAPGSLAIGLFVIHTLVSELIFGRSLGKAVMGLRVVTLRGETPRGWQVLVRNALKTFDLIAWLLLVLLIIGPFRQRLGDLIARTVVVMPTEPEQQEGTGE